MRFVIYQTTQGTELTASFLKTYIVNLYLYQCHAIQYWKTHNLFTLKQTRGKNTTTRTHKGRYTSDTLAIELWRKRCLYMHEYIVKQCVFTISSSSPLSPERRLQLAVRRRPVASPGALVSIEFKKK